MAFLNYKEHSKRNWGKKAQDESEGLTLEQINTGCLQRIADATEIMATNYVQLQRDLDNYKRWYKDANERVDKRDKTIAALRGQITKLRKKLNNLQPTNDETEQLER